MAPRAPAAHKKTIFIHIPKTAGESLREIVRRLYPRGRRVEIYSHDPHHLDRVRRKLARAEVIYGHVSFGAHDFFGVEARYVTILREPVARVVSYFRHQAIRNDNDNFQRIAAGMTLHDMLRDEQNHQVNNHMVRILSGHGDPATTGDRALLERAQLNLDTQFDAVGITERMDESVALIARALGWRGTFSVPRINTDPRPQAYVLDDDTRAEIVRYNSLDIELYDWTVRKYFAGDQAVNAASADSPQVSPSFDRNERPG